MKTASNCRVSVTGWRGATYRIQLEIADNPELQPEWPAGK
jgi:hypothetical protein